MITKVLGGDPVSYRRMPMAHLEYFIKKINEDIKNEDIFLVPQPPVRL